MLVTNDNLDRDAYQQTLYDVAQAVQLEEEMLVHPYHHLHPIKNIIILKQYDLELIKLNLSSIYTCILRQYLGLSMNNSNA